MNFRSQLVAFVNDACVRGQCYEKHEFRVGACFLLSLTLVDDANALKKTQFCVAASCFLSHMSVYDANALKNKNLCRALWLVVTDECVRGQGFEKMCHSLLLLVTDECVQG